MSYVESNLGRDEKILARVTHSKAAIIGDFVLAIIVVGIAVGIYYGVGALGGWLISLGAPDVFDVITLVIQAIVLAVGVLIGVWNILSGALQIKFNQLVVTNKRLLGRKGIIAKTVIDMPLTKLDNIQSNNGIFGGIFHYGELKIVSAGSQRIVNGNTVDDLVYPYVKNTEAFRRDVLAAIDKAKEEEREAQAEAQAEAMKRVQEKMQAENK